MIFLIEYNRPKGLVVSINSFKDSEQEEAEITRLDLEIDLNRKGINHEVVLLVAKNKKAIRQTHARYFTNIREIAKRHG